MGARPGFEILLIIVQIVIWIELRCEYIAGLGLDGHMCVTGKVWEPAAREHFSVGEASGDSVSDIEGVSGFC